MLTVSAISPFACLPARFGYQSTGHTTSRLSAVASLHGAKLVSCRFDRMSSQPCVETRVG
jgi:hypothetical protein